MPTLTGCSVCLKRALAIAKSFSRGSASIAIAAEFFWVSVMVVFMVACGLQKYTPCCKELRLRIWVHTIYYQPGQLQEFRPPEGRDNLQLSPGRRPPRGRGSGMGSVGSCPPQSCCDRLTLRVVLLKVSPLVARLISVLDDLSLEELHDISVIGRNLRDVYPCSWDAKAGQAAMILRQTDLRFSC